MCKNCRPKCAIEIDSSALRETTELVRDLSFEAEYLTMLYEEMTCAAKKAAKKIKRKLRKGMRKCNQPSQPK